MKRRALIVGLMLTMGMNCMNVSAAENTADCSDLKVSVLLPTVGAEYFVKLGEGVTDVMASANCENVSVASYDGDSAKAIEMIENCITAKTDVICMFAIDSSTSDALKSAMEAGIKVISYGVDSESYDHLIVVDNKEDGKALADMAYEWIAENLPEGSEIATLGSTVNANMADRSNAMNERLEELVGDQYKIVEEVFVDGSGEDGTSVTENLLEKYPDVKALVTYSDDYATRAVEVFKSRDITGDDIAIFGNDATEQALVEIADNDILRGSIFNGNGGEIWGQAIIDWFDGKIEVDSINYLPNIAVTIDNVKDYR